MKIKLASSDVDAVFAYLDTDLDSYLTYQEFCGLLEEKRRHLDPFSQNSS